MKRKCSDRLWMNLFLISETSFLQMIFFFPFFYVCVFASSILKSEHSVWTWFGSSPVTWLWPDHLLIRELVAFWMFRVFVTLVYFLFDGCVLFPRPLSSTHLHVLLFLLTTLFQPSNWSKDEIKPAHFIDGPLKSENGSYGNFFYQKEKKIYLASPVSPPAPTPHWVIYTVNSPGYFGSSPQRLLFQHHQHFPFISPTVGSV